MLTVRTCFSRLMRRSDGAAAVEFALALPILAGMTVAVVEFSMMMFAQILMENGLRDASRYGITGFEETGVSRLERIAQIVDEQTLGLVDMSKAEFEMRVYPSFGDVGRGEDFVDGNANGVYDSGETFTDENGNGIWDSDVGEPGPGGAGEVVAYRLNYDWPLFTPLADRFIGTEGKFHLRAGLVVRNEPWDSTAAGGGA